MANEGCEGALLHQGAIFVDTADLDGAADADVLPEQDGAPARIIKWVGKSLIGKLMNNNAHKLEPYIRTYYGEPITHLGHHHHIDG